MFVKPNAKKLVEKNKWDKIRAIMEKSDSETVIKLAEQCGMSNCDEAYNVLINLLGSNDRDIKIAAIKALGILGKETATTHLMHLANNLSDDTELMKEIRSSLIKMKN